jgi:hypothetical protein
MVTVMISGSSLLKGLYFYPWPLWIPITIEISPNSPCLWASFHPLESNPSFSGKSKAMKFDQTSVWNAETWYEMLNLSFLCTSFERNYSGCTGRSTENLCQWRSSGKKKDRVKTQEQFWWFPKFDAPLEWLMYFFGDCFLVPPCVWQNSGYWCCLFLTLLISLISL